MRFDLAFRLSEDLTIAGRAMTAGADKDNVYFLAALYKIPLESRNFELTLRSDISWGTKRHLRTEFGVTSEQSNNSGYATYLPDAGLKSIGVAVSGKYHFNPYWFAYTDFSYEKYSDAGADSPFIDNDYDIEAAVGVGYRF